MYTSHLRCLPRWTFSLFLLLSVPAVRAVRRLRSCRCCCSVFQERAEAGVANGDNRQTLWLSRLFSPVIHTTSLLAFMHHFSCAFSPLYILSSFSMNLLSKPNHHIQEVRPLNSGRCLDNSGLLWAFNLCDLYCCDWTVLELQTNLSHLPHALFLSRFMSPSA